MKKYQANLLTRKKRVMLRARRRMPMFWIVMVFVLSLSKWANAEEHGGDESHLENRKKIDLFVGVTYIDIEGRGDQKLSVGISFEHRIDSLVGAGGIVEYTDGIDAWILAPALYVHPAKRWTLVLAAGIEFEDSRDEFLGRVGAKYDFEFGAWSLSPEFNFDFVDSEVNEVIGISIGRAFQ